MRILDRYILSRFLLNFISSFAILLFIFIFQAIWLFVEEWAGKDLDITVMFKFLWNLIPTLLDKVIPFTVLLASILTFGNFAENYEFAAMKASGVSLMRSMRVLTVFSVLLGISMFLLVNYVTPKSEQQIFNMRTNLKDIKPASVIVEGVFSDIQGSNMNMMVEEKFGEDDSKLRNIVIHQRSRTGKNTTVIRAATGELLGGGESSQVQLILYDGYYYEEIQPTKAAEQRKHPFARARFGTYIKNIDLSTLVQRNIDDDRGIITDKMKSVERLYRDIDSLERDNQEQIRAFSRTASLRLGAFPIMNTKSKDSLPDTELLERQPSARMNISTPTTSRLPVDDGREWVRQTDTSTRSNNRSQDILPPDSTVVDSVVLPDALAVMANLPYWKQEQVYSSASNNVESLLNTVRAKADSFKIHRERYNRHLLSLHKKFALAFACVILFFIGAPLGAIIKKGGVGFPMVIAFLLFIVYYFLGVFTENYSKKGFLDPVLGAWISTVVMLPLSIVLTRRANKDKQFAGINTGFSALFRRLLPKRDAADAPEPSTGFPGPETLLSLTLKPEARSPLEKLSEPELKEYALGQYSAHSSWAEALPALKILHERNADLSDLRRRYLMDRSEAERYKMLLRRFNRVMPVLLITFILSLGSYLAKVLGGAGAQSALYLFLGLFSLGSYVLTYGELIRTLGELRHTRVGSGRILSLGDLVFSFFLFPLRYASIRKRVNQFISTSTYDLEARTY